jgi:hypothetical protein
MSVTIDQAMAFVEVLSKGAPAVHFKAIIGAGKVATAEDFLHATEPCCVRAEDLLAAIDEYTGALRGVVEQNRVKIEQRRLEDEQREAERIEDERRNSIPGTTVEDLAALQRNGKKSVEEGTPDEVVKDLDRDPDRSYLIKTIKTRKVVKKRRRAHA